MVYTVRFFLFKLQYVSCLFGSCFIHILYTVCAKIKKNNSGAKRLTEHPKPPHTPAFLFHSSHVCDDLLVTARQTTQRAASESYCIGAT